jgi:CTP:molybdopterin cytidylyltransferase MocA
MGTPKALLIDGAGASLAAVAVARLRAAGCEDVTVVLGAEADRAASLLPAGSADVVVADDWAEGMGASLRRGLESLVGGGAVAALVTLVDLPDVGDTVMRRVLDRWRADGGGAGALVRATYDGRPGHPVLLGSDHWEPLVVTLAGDSGAQGYLAGRRVLEVSCEDLATGRDVDRPEELDR